VYIPVGIMENAARKVLRVAIYLTYYNICLLLVASTVYLNFLTLIIIALDQLVFAADTLIRPVTPREKADFTTKIIGLLFILHPFLLTFLFYDNLLFTSIYLVILDAPVISYIGIAIYILGALITLASRIQLGRYGDGTITIKDEHELMTNGVYQHVRNPLYFGALLGRLGLALSFRGYIIGFLMISGFLILFSKRIEIEETELEEKFGESFRSYKERTKKLIPYIW
jgi:protein-S-isoprenylcysteine O-methyltransferase Ste14